MKVHHQFGMPKEAVQRWADWYGMPYLGFVGFALARTGCKVRYGIYPGHGEGIDLAEAYHAGLVTVGPFRPEPR